MADKKNCENLDKYYTKDEVAKKCFCILNYYLLKCNTHLKNTLFIEPSAGNGRMLNIISQEKLGFDISPEHDTIHKCDFLSSEIDAALQVHLLDDTKQLVFFGNPPFGKKAKLAIDFLNKALSFGAVVGFIVPIQFRKWSVQSKINPNAKLIRDVDLQEDAFTLLDKPYSLRCCFQIWAINDTKNSDLRISAKPKTDHIDFKMYQYNRTTEAEKFFDYDWDFAVPRQGYLDYTFKAFDKTECDKKQQWIFFKAGSQKILEQLKMLDFVKLSLKNSGIPGFGKADVIAEYNKLC